MDFFRSYYNKIFGPVYKNMGFMKKGNMFYRVSNDIVQFFFIQKYGGGCCTINIGLVPLCMKDVINSLYSSSRLSLGDIVYGQYKSWYYEQTEDDIKRVLNEMLYLTNTYLIDLFNKVTNCSHLYSYIIGLKINTFIHSGIDIYACLKCGLYDKALGYLNDMLNQTDKNVNENLESWKMNDELSPERINEYIERTKENRKLITDLINAIKENDVEYIEDLLKRNEGYTSNALSAKKT